MLYYVSQNTATLSSGAPYFHKRKLYLNVTVVTRNESWFSRHTYRGRQGRMNGEDANLGGQMVSTYGPVTGKINKLSLTHKYWDELRVPQTVG